MSAVPHEKPLIVQSDNTVLLDLHAPEAAQASERLSQFAELVKSPEHMHTYRINPLSIWNARSLGLSADDMVGTIEAFAKYPPPESVLTGIRDLAARYGCVVLEREGDQLRLVVEEASIAALLCREKKVSPFIGHRESDKTFQVNAAFRGLLKQALVEVGYPADDRAGYVDGDLLEISLNATTRNKVPFVIRDYQLAAATAFHRAGSRLGGSGVICLPCGAGKTIIGITVMERLQQTTLILTTSMTSVKQWRRELLDKTNIPVEKIALYTGEQKNIGPVTISTYQMLTWRPDAEADFPHLALFFARSWGLILYDEVHLLPAPVFRVTADLQARRRLGMTATLIREDGREGDVFALIGPKRYDIPWRNLEGQGWIADSSCVEVKVPMDKTLQMAYAMAARRYQFRIAAENPLKLRVVESILEQHPDSRVLIIGEFIRQLEAVAGAFGFPLITGKTPQKTRELHYQQFKDGRLRHLILSRVGNFALDLPDADLLIQISGVYGSRQEEAQRLGRILRPKPDGRQAWFYTLVSHRSREEAFAQNRQLFLAEQGYSYQVAFFEKD